MLKYKGSTTQSALFLTESGGYITEMDGQLSNFDNTYTISVFRNIMSHHQHFMLNKPFGYISQFIHNEKKRRNKKMLGDLYDFPEGTMAIGRLDKGSEGLLLLTTDGKVSSAVRDKSIEKEYYVMVDGIATDETIERLKSGVEIDIKGTKYKTLPCEAKKLEYSEVSWISDRPIRDEKHGPTSWVSITLTEGKFRQVRKMTAAVGFPTLRLIRVRIGEIKLGVLPVSEVIEKPDLLLEVKSKE